MHRVPANSKVRRQLFPAENVEEQAKIDNFANILQESIARDRKDKSIKYNFDFEKEIPLQGPYEWYRQGEDGWIGMKLEDTDMPENFVRQHDNENTPVQVRDESVPVIRKRRKNIETESQNRTVKRRVDFDTCSFLRRSEY